MTWAALDAEAEEADPSPIYQAMRTITAQMEARFPEEWERHKRRMTNMLERWGNEPKKLTAPKVINRHHYLGDDGEPDHNKLPIPYIYIGRGTTLGNPYKVAEHGGKALELYRAWLWQKVKQRDAKTLRAFAGINWDTHLVCSCAPRPCHGDVVVSTWLWLQRQPWWSKEEFG